MNQFLSFPSHRPCLQRRKGIGQAGFELWLGRGRPLFPYLRGFLVDYLRKELKTKELKLPPDELFLHRNVKDLFCWSTYLFDHGLSSGSSSVTSIMAAY